MADLTFEEAKFTDIMVTVFLKQIETTESFLNGADLSDAKIQALAIRKKVRAVQPPKADTGNTKTAELALVKAPESETVPIQ